MGVDEPGGEVVPGCVTGQRRVGEASGWAAVIAAADGATDSTCSIDHRLVPTSLTVPTMPQPDAYDMMCL